MRRIVTIAVALVAALAGTMAIASPAQARVYPRCDTYRWVQTDAYNDVEGYLWAKVPAASGGGTCELILNDTGTGVRILQNNLNRCYYGYYGAIDVDGHFGYDTRGALLLAQAAVGLTQDGWYVSTVEGTRFRWATQDYKGYWQCGRPM